MRKQKQWFLGALAAGAVSLAVVPGADSETAIRACADAAGRVVECVEPSATDPAIRRFDTPHYVLFNAKTGPDADLLIFLPGTGGEPPGPLKFLEAAADAGYRVISLAYNDTPAAAVYCPRKPDPACSEKFRRMRIDGDGRIDPAIDNTGAESIVNRLVKLLRYLAQREPDRKWSNYLEDGTLNWRRIAFAGQSQGAGMAAFIAKEHVVARVILFSSPWDFVVSNGNIRKLAPWIAMPAKTPPDRWFGGYHARENTAGLIAEAYAALRIPPDHIRVFRLGLPASRPQGRGGNPFHGEGIRDPAYAEQRAFFLGRSP
jgi:predicted esterase